MKIVEREITLTEMGTDKKTRMLQRKNVTTAYKPGTLIAGIQVKVPASMKKSNKRYDEVRFDGLVELEKLQLEQRKAHLESLKEPDKADKFLLVRLFNRLIKAAKV